MSVQGWECPKCGRVYGPHIDECKPCNDAAVVQEWMEYERADPIVIPAPYPVPIYPSIAPAWERGTLGEYWRPDPFIWPNPDWTYAPPRWIPVDTGGSAGIYPNE